MIHSTTIIRRRFQSTRVWAAGRDEMEFSQPQLALKYQAIMVGLHQVVFVLQFKKLTFNSPTDDTGETITVRGCALDSGTLTTDTELIRMSHCGRFYYDDR